MSALDDQLAALRNLVKKKTKTESVSEPKPGKFASEPAPEKQPFLGKKLDQKTQEQPFLGKKLDQKTPFSEKAAQKTTPEKQPFLTPFEKRQKAKAEAKAQLKQEFSKVPYKEEPKTSAQKIASPEELRNLGQKTAPKTPEQKPAPEAAGKYAFKKDVPKPEPKQAFGKSHVAKTGEGGGIKQSLANFYYFFEDGYYGLMDKINSAVPVYKVIDPIDKVFPSFILFVAVILVILFLLASFFLFPVIPEKAVLTITLTKEDSDEKLSDYEVVLFVNGQKNTYKTDKNSQVVLKEVDLNSTVKVKVSDVPGYEDFEELFKVEEKEFFFTAELIKEKPDQNKPTKTRKTVLFKGAKSGNLIMKFLRASFDCSKDNSSLEIVGQSSLTKSTDTGTIQIEFIQKDCGDVLVSAQADGYTDVVDKKLPSSNTIFMQKEDVPAKTKGTIHIKVFDEMDNLIQDRMKFSLFEESDSLNPVYGYDDVSIFDGVKDFEISPGSYFVKVFDANTDSPKHSCDNPSETKELLAGEEIDLEITCIEAAPEDVIAITVQDSNSHVPVESLIELRKAKSLELVAVKDGAASANFAVSEDIDYIAIVSAEGYLPYEGEDILRKGDSLAVALIEANEQTAGKAKIKVYNAGGNPASSGTVFLRYADGEFEGLRTDYFGSVGFKGEVLIERVKPGNYYAEAFISDEKGFSDAKPVDENTLTLYTVHMEKIRGNAEFKVTKLGTSLEISTFDVNFFDAITKEKIPESEYTFNPLNNNYSLDAGEYYAVISKATYHSTRTKNFLVVPKGKIIVNVALPKVTGEEVSINFMGLFKENGLPVDQIDLEKEYSAEFMFTVNPTSDIFYFNFLIGTGTTLYLNTDSIYISSFENPFDKAKVKKTTSFTENYNTDFSNNLTSGDAKAVLVEFNEFNERDFLETAFVIPVKVKIKEDILEANSLRVFFKAMAVGNSVEAPEYYLNPEDLRQFTSIEEYTYSKHKTETLSICSDYFCHAFLIENASTEPLCSVIQHGSVSSLRLSCPYSLSSFILNNDADYDNTTFTLDSVSVPSNPNNAVPLDAIIFNNYEIRTKGNTFSGTADSSFIEETFDLKFGSIISTNANLTPVVLAKTTDGVPAIRTMLYSLNEIDKNFHEIRIRSDLSLNLTLYDTEGKLLEEIEPFIETPFSVEVLDGEGIPVEYARVTVKITDSATEEESILASIETDEFGQVLFVGQEAIKGLYPNSVVDIIAEFNDINVSKSIQVNDKNTFEFAPERLVYGFFPSETELQSKNIIFYDLSEGLLNQEIGSADFEWDYHAEYIKTEEFEGAGERFLADGITTEVSFGIDTNKTSDLNSNLSIEGRVLFVFNVEQYHPVRAVSIEILINSYSEYLDAFILPGGTMVTEENPVLVSMFSDGNSSSVEFMLKEKPDINLGDINILEVEVRTESDYLDKSQMQEIFEQHKGKAFADNTTLDFTAVLNSAASTIKEKTTQSGEIRFVFDAAGTPDLMILPFEVEIIPSEKVLGISPKEMKYEFFIDDAQPITKTLSLTNNFSQHSITIRNISFGLENEGAGLVLAKDPNFALPIELTSKGKDFNFTVELTDLAAEITTSQHISGEVDLNYSVGNKDLFESVPVNVSVSTAQRIIQSEFFDLKACIGEGGLSNIAGDFWIGCDITKGITTSRECTSEKPKITLDWQYNTFAPTWDNEKWMNEKILDGNSLCTKPTEEYENYVYCDAAQFSLDLVHRVIKFKGDEYDKEGSFSYRTTLIEDNLSLDDDIPSEFFRDFDDFMMSGFLDAPIKYTLPGEAYEEYAIIRKYFDKGKIFAVPEKTLEIETPGWYDVIVHVFDSKLEIDFSLIKTSAELEEEMDSVFYYTPFDGPLARDKKVDGEKKYYQRVGYGSSFDVSSSTGKFRVDDSYEIFSSPDLNGAKILWVTEFNDLDALNSGLKKGVLLELARDSTRLRTMKFYPSYATPITMKVTLNNVTSEAALYYYISNEENTKPLVDTTNLVVWDALGDTCRDFSNTKLKGLSFEDEKATSEDQGIIGGYENVFKLSWSPVSRTGNLFMHSVIYSPAFTPNYFNIASYTDNPFDEVNVYSTYNPGEQDRIPLSGSSIPFNNREANNNQSADSLSEIFDLVDSGYACVKNEANFTYIMWNEEKILEELSSRESELNILSECIQN